MWGWIVWAYTNVVATLKGLFMTYSKIDEGIYQGGAYADSYPEGVTAVVNLENGIDQKFPTGVHAYLWMPIDDGPPFPGVLWLHTAVKFIEACRDVDWGVLIHCTAGVSRSGMVDVAYHMYKNRWTRDQALTYVREMRPQTDPNPSFMEGLLKYQDFLHL